MLDLDKKNIRIMLASVHREHCELLELDSELRKLSCSITQDVESTYSILYDVYLMIVRVEIPLLIEVMGRDKVKVFEVRRMLSAAKPKSFERYASIIGCCTQQSDDYSRTLCCFVEKMIDLKYSVFNLLLAQYVSMKSLREVGCFNPKDLLFLREVGQEICYSSARQNRYTHLVKYLTI